jgi:hypothetical protein
LAATGSLASPAIRSYNRAWVRDIFDAYPDIDGIRPDWPEYPCYTLGETFQDFGHHVAAWATANGYDFVRIQREAAALYRYLHGSLSNADLIDFAGPDRGRFTVGSLFNRFPGIADWFRLKAALSTDLLRDYRDAINEAAGPSKMLSANAFMPPLSYFTGMDFTASSAYCDSISPKLYTMHWSLIVKFWAEALLEANQGVDEALLVRALVNMLDLADNQVDATIADYGYPAPNEPHPIPDNPQIRKLNQALSSARGHTKIYALVHGYGPIEDFERRFRLAAESPVDGVWINRYGYLSDAKLDVIRQVWR